MLKFSYITVNPVTKARFTKSIHISIISITKNLVIMKKTILTGVMACGILFTGLMASASVAQPEVYRESKVIAAFEINSFCKAIIKGDIEMVQKMIALGEDVNQKSLGKTPAHYAARYNKPEILKLLIANGANLKKRCDQGYTVKKYAELSEAKEVIKVIDSAMKK